MLPSPGLHKNASLVTTSYGIDNNLYMDSIVTNHVTVELEKLTVCDKYDGHDLVHSANGVGMEIQHVGSSNLCSHTSTICLQNILHVPQASKSLLVR